jgi:hypothetical protein
VGKKDPIPFQLRKKQRAQAKKGRAARRPPNVRPPTSGGELDEVLIYWRQFAAKPFDGPGRNFWTERMLWGNAILTALATMLGLALEDGFRLYVMVGSFVNVFFLFALAYYVIPWVTDWIFRKLHIPASNVDGLKVEMIVLSGWLVVASLIRLIPFFQPLPYWGAMLGFAVLIVLAVHRRVRSTWGQSALAGGGAAIVLGALLLILSQL